MNKSSVLLSARNITKKFRLPGGGNELIILHSLSLSVSAGDTVAIVGASGSGKTTLLALLAGLDLPDKGSISIDGEDITQLSEKDRSILRARKLSFVFQDFLLLPHLTTLENTMLPLEMRGDKQARRRALAGLQRVGLADRAEHYPSQLSGGEQQRAGLVRAFVAEPRILFADEPNGNLDRKTGDQVARLLFQLNDEESTTLMLVTHDMRLAQQCAVIYELKEGRLSRMQKRKGR